MTRRFPAALASALCIALLGGCGSDETMGFPTNAHVQPDPEQRATQGGGLSLFNTGGAAKPDANAGGIPVNAYLWRGALDTLKFMPLTQADPFGGVIITDWWTPPSSPGERFKATAYILGRQLRTDALRVTVFRQVQQGGQWVDAPVDPSKATDLENVVLTKARELRSQSASGS